VATKTLINWPLGMTAVGGLAVLGLLFSALQEMNPLNGFWVVHRATEGGKPVPGVDQWRVFLEIEGDHASIASYWTCGGRQETFAEGIMVRKGDQIELYKRVRMTPELENSPSGHFTILPNREIGFDIRGTGGDVAHLVFRRESNTPTLLDIFGWQ
jgi:hypothetical protein